MGGGGLEHSLNPAEVALLKMGGGFPNHLKMLPAEPEQSVRIH